MPYDGWSSYTPFAVQLAIANEYDLYMEQQAIFKRMSERYPPKLWPNGTFGHHGRRWLADLAHKAHVRIRETDPGVERYTYFAGENISRMARQYTEWLEFNGLLPVPAPRPEVVTEPSE